MRIYRIAACILLLQVGLASLADAACPIGDFTDDCKVDFADFQIMAEQWLESVCSGGDCADLDGIDGVNMRDLAIFGSDWAKEGVGANVKINEIHYDPDVKTELVEYVELYNAGPEDVDLSGWYFSDGISYTFPPATILPSGRYLVVAQDPAQLTAKFDTGISEVLGPFGAKLDNEGEKITLRDANGDKVDAVDYDRGFPWPITGDPPGYSIELVNPDFDNDLGGNWRPSKPDSVAQPTTLIQSKALWKYKKGDSEASDPVSAWRYQWFDDSSWNSGNLMLGYGEDFLTTVLSDMRGDYSSVYLRKSFTVDDPAEIDGLSLELIFDDGFIAYINGQYVESDNVSGTEQPHTGTAGRALEDHDWKQYQLQNPSQYIVAGENVLAIHLFNASLSSSSDCFIDVRLENVPGLGSNGPTPGRLNTTYTDNIGPKMRQVDHSPKQPASTDDVKITMKVTDSDGVDSVILSYQPVYPGAYFHKDDPQYLTNWTEISMHDDGTGGDEEPDDSIYTAVIPASLNSHRLLMRYRITATDGAGLTVRAPYEDDPQPNFAYFVYDGVPSWSGAIDPDSRDPDLSQVVTYAPDVLTRNPVYHLISKKQDVLDAQFLPGTIRNSGYGGDLYLWTGTLVYDGDVYDHVHYRARGGVWRYAMGKNMWKFDFNRGHFFKARNDYGKKYDTTWDKLNFSACIQQGDYLHRGEQGMFEAAGFKLFNLMGVEAPKTHWVHYRVIDDVSESGPTQYDSDFWGLYLVIEQMDGRFLDEHKLPDGNLYKIEGHDAELNNQGLTAVTDKSDFNAFKSGYYYDPDPTELWWRSNVDLDRYYGYRCIVEGIHHGDIGYGKNYFFYLNPETNIWYMLPWDLDLTWANNMYGNGEEPFKNQGKIFSNPQLSLEYKNRLREFHDLLYNTDQMYALLDELASLIDPTNGPTIVDADRAMWDYNPIMTSYTVNSRKSGEGRFYKQAPSEDFPGMVRIMKDYVTGYREFATSPEDSQAPYTPSVTYDGPSGYPANALVFNCSNFLDPQGAATFAAMKWRLAEVTDKANPNYSPEDKLKLEIEADWESPEFTDFNDTILIPAGEVRPGRSYRVRVRMKDNSGRWSHWSDHCQFIAGEPLNAAVLSSLRITELMYNPADPPAVSPYGNDDFEFIELKNTGDDTIDLAYVSFTNGITFDFADSAVTTLDPGQFVLVVKNIAAFESRYGAGLSHLIAGRYEGNEADNFANGGESVKLVDYWNGTIANFEYGDNRGWPLAADGHGHSLVPLDSAVPHEPDGVLDYGGNWRASAYMGGSPGYEDPVIAPSVILNEVMAHTDYSSPQHPDHDSNDWIELYNAGDEPLSLGGFYLSDDIDDPVKWPVPNVAIGPGGYLTFDEVSHFHNPITTGFGLNKAGEMVVLSWFGPGPDRIVDVVRFEGEENDISLGRHPNGGQFWMHTIPSRNAANAIPVADLVINEIMYNPEVGKVEYIELLNTTTEPITLDNSEGPWKLAGVDYDFPTGLTVSAGQTLLVVPFDPFSATSDLLLFKYFYNAPDLIPGVNIVGPWAGNLSNAGERLAIEKPQAPDAPGEGISWVIVDEVMYYDRHPWPSQPDGTGSSLSRISTSSSGNDPANWLSSIASPGRP